MNKIYYFAICVMACLVSCNPSGGVLPGTEDATSRKVATGDVFNITSSTAVITGSTKIDLSDYQDVAFGVMYSDNKDELSARRGNRNEAPYLNGQEFEVEIKGLKPQTVYYYCAWLFLNGKQYEYGDIKQFETLEGHVYAIGKFSVSNTKKVAFSSGNLQYQASTDTWRFAENQWDYIGGANSNISSSYSGWIDLFGWGTGNNPTESSSSVDAYDYFSDWGKNTINNEAPNTWRTLTKDEWNYLFEGRQNSYSLSGTATVNNVHGLIILPDDWNEPNLSFTSGTKEWEDNVYSTAEWQELEYEGAVFLPAAGSRARSYGGDGFYVDDVQSYGFYWSATEYNSNYNSNYAYYLIFGSDEETGMSYFDRDSGHSVRLVKDLQ